MNDMTQIISSNSHNPVQQYALVEKKTSGRKSYSAEPKVDSIQKSFGFKWKGFGIEYQSQDIQVEPSSLAQKSDKKFFQELNQAQEIKSLSRFHSNHHYGPLQPRAAAISYDRQYRAPLEYSHPMINLSV
ncbi:MAG: hypothetical protein D5R98_01570 [Desulfonatronovibrio sp. MSAO_Bac4]|nr:MAG: hypothetical protein D5R98_01570 [Desulfonatronovibrio sp. MSAO_Bac4]